MLFRGRHGASHVEAVSLALGGGMTRFPLNAAPPPA